MMKSPVFGSNSRRNLDPLVLLFSEPSCRSTPAGVRLADAISQAIDTEVQQ